MPRRGASASTEYVRADHAAVRTSHFLFNQLIPYIGNKRKLLGLIERALSHTERTHPSTLLDLFSGSGVVARLAKTLGYRVFANDWEPYSRSINGCYIACNQPPPFARLGGYEQALATLNSLAPRIDWVTNHLCPRDDENYDIAVDRMFYMRKNGLKIDAVRHQLELWREDGTVDQPEFDCLLAPLLYQACYRSNTSGVFKGFHNGWGGQTQTALYRIATDLVLTPAVFHDNGHENQVLCGDAQQIAEELPEEVDVAYLDPPYNQHPYGSNYHVLNSVALWDKPDLGRTITTHGTKSAIRTDWRTLRRSAYNHGSEAAAAYRRLVETLRARFILTSYSTDGTIPLDDLLAANVARGRVRVEMQGYKRYRVSSQRFSDKPMNVEVIVIVDTHSPADLGVDELHRVIMATEESVLKKHPEISVPTETQRTLFQLVQEL